jgi:hypothetical protein
MTTYIFLAVICLSANCDDSQVQTGNEYNSIQDCQSAVVIMEQTIKSDGNIWVRLECFARQPIQSSESL